MKMTLLVARTDAPERLAEAAGVRDLRPASWAEGAAAARARPGAQPSCALTRPVDGWVVLASDRLPTHRGDDAMGALLEGASAWLAGAEVLAFASLPSGDYQAWSRAADGRVTRAFYWFGAEDRAHELGERTPAELELGVPGHDPAATTPEHVLEVARRWCLDPSALPWGREAPGEVWVGALPDPEETRRAAREAALDQASRDVAAALEVEVQEDVGLAPSGGGGDARERLDGMAAHMATLGYQVVWSGDRTRFEATPPEGVSLPPMAFGLDDV
ncbi:MAG: hypothetical protein KF878_07385 [Planctomycetes bacterium]|nr:hypothetical protein [Planctomycetota bacterium]